MLEGFVLWKNGRLYLDGCQNKKLIYASCRRPIVLRKSKIFGKSSGRSRCFFSHGSEHSRSVLILIKNSWEFELVSVRPDKEGRFIFLEVLVQDQK